MGDKPKTAFELAMERLNAEDREAGTKETALTPKQKEAIAEARRVASSRLAEREILFRDSMKKTPDPETARRPRSSTRSTASASTTTASGRSRRSARESSPDLPKLSPCPPAPTPPSSASCPGWWRWRS